MARYYPEPERILLADLGGFEAVRQHRKKICTSRRYKYHWLRIDPCIELPDVEEEDVPQLNSSREASEFLHNAIPFAGRNVEFFMIVITNNKLRPIAVAMPHKGGRNASVVEPAVVPPGRALGRRQQPLLFAHNHPSNEPLASQEDVAMTKRLQRASELVGLQFLDHLILTDYPVRYLSFRDAGLLN